ncbi:MAG: hypothetical protein QOF62_3130 [Pyrinomonadaceae bacterium]|jgi:hypothetical protein|nr:hypothetical protein [Pyrinomonadaceae bacterium]
MDLSDFYPPPHDLIHNERNALDYLVGDPYIAGEHSRFLNDAVQYRRQYGEARRGFRFFSYLDVYHGQMPSSRPRRGTGWKRSPNIRLIIAALIDQQDADSYSNISYSLVVCRIRSRVDGATVGHPRLSILRKLHFDMVANAAAVRQQPHPLSHLQYCGEMIPLMRNIGLRDEQLLTLHPSLSEPRLFFWPMSLALLIDMALHEFPNVESAKFRAKTEWRRRIRDSEALLLRPFHQKCVDIIATGQDRDLILADEFYV